MPSIKTAHSPHVPKSGDKPDAGTAVAERAVAAPAEADRDAPYRAPAALQGLPDLMIEFAQVAGLEAAWRLFETRGGNRIYIPARAGDGHWLVQIVGREAADRICAHFAAGDKGMEYELPLGPTGIKAALRRRLETLIAEGASSTAITREIGITRRSVSRHRARMAAVGASPQLDMFRSAETADPPRLPLPAKKCT